MRANKFVAWCSQPRFLAFITPTRAPCTSSRLPTTPVLPIQEIN
jgi:hypothetical protein